MPTYISEETKKVALLEAKVKQLEEANAAKVAANADKLQGKVQRLKKQDGTDSKLFEVMLYQVDPKTEDPIQNGSFTGADGKEHPKYKIGKIFTFAESSFLKVAAGEARSCNLYYRRRRY